MREMTRAEMQDLLPMLAHDALDADERAQIEAALETDADLASELAVLRRVIASQRAVPPINVAQIVAALPSPVSSAATPLTTVDDLSLRREAKRPRISMRFARAAAMVVVVAGGTLVSVFGRGTRDARTVPPVVGAESIAILPAAQSGLGLGAPTDELSVDQLKALEEEIRTLDGLPAADLGTNQELLAEEGA
jgi:anti-sigma factor RsiW